MFHRRKSVGDRVRDFIPVLTLVALGSGAVAVAMYVLVTFAPVVIGTGPSPSPADTGPTFPVVPSYAIVTEPPSQLPVATASLPANLPVLGTRRLNEQDPAGVWDVSLAYPEFRTGSTPWATQINDEILTLERSQADRFEQGPAAARQQPGRTNHLVGTYATELLTPRLASFTLSWTDDTSPGHVATTVGTLTVDLATGQPIGFDDLFVDPDGALQILSTESADLLYYQLGAAWDQTIATQGTSPTHANFANWALTRDGLKVTFDQYQVVNGEQTPSVLVPWSALVPVLVTSGPVASLAGVAPVQPSPAAGASGSAAPSGSAAASGSAAPSGLVGSVASGSPAVSGSGGG
jgi:hypothetical protein